VKNTNCHCQIKHTKNEYDNECRVEEQYLPKGGNEKKFILAQRIA